VSGGAAPANSLIRSRFRASRSGAFSWIQSTVPASSAADGAKVMFSGSAPGNRPSRVAEGQALPMNSLSRFSAAGSGSHATTEWPRPRARTVHPAPITPVPTTPIVRPEESGLVTEHLGNCSTGSTVESPRHDPPCQLKPRVWRASAGDCTAAPISSMIVTAFSTSWALVASTPRSR